MVVSNVISLKFEVLVTPLGIRTIMLYLKEVGTWPDKRMEVKMALRMEERRG